MSLGPVTNGKDFNFFNRILVSSSTFNENCDIIIGVPTKNTSFFNEGIGVVEISFNGTTVHSELNYSSGISNVNIENERINKIWFRLKSGTPSVVRIQNNATVHSSTIIQTVSSDLTTTNGILTTIESETFHLLNVDSKLTTTNSNLSTINTNTDHLPSIDTTTLLIESDTSHLPSIDNKLTATNSDLSNINSNVLIGDGYLNSIDNKLTTANLSLSNINSNTLVADGYLNTINSTSSSINSNVLIADGYLNTIANSVNSSLINSPSIGDAFGRLRVSTPYAIFDSKQLFDDRPVYWDTSTSYGGTSTYNSNQASSSLSTTSTIGSTVIRQTRRVFYYQPGKSLLFMTTFCFNTTADGIRKRVGYFDVDNGVFLQNLGGILSFVVRDSLTGSPNDTTVNQSNWNIDKFDGYGQSGILLDQTKAQLMVIDFEWLGVGRVRTGFIIGGKIHYAHEFKYGNVINTVYMGRPNLPIRYEIVNVSGSTSSTLTQICSSVISEGGLDSTGLLFSADRGASEFQSVSSASMFPILSLRLNYAKKMVSIFPVSVEVLCTSSNANFKWALIYNPTVNGVDNASWTSLTNAAVEYDISRTSANTITGGTQIKSGYGNQKVALSSGLIDTAMCIGYSIAGVADQLVLGVQKIGNGTDSFVGSISWRGFQ